MPSARQHGKNHRTMTAIPTTARGSENRLAWLGAVFLIGLTVLSFFPALHAGWIWDDQDYIVTNANLRDASGLARIWTDAYSNWQFYPLVFTTFWFEFHAWGLHTFGYHLDNVFLQACSAVLLWRLLLRLEFKSSIALLSAAIFAVHPVQVETVAWISERKNLLCGLFYFAAMLVFLRMENGKLLGPPSRRYLPAFFLFFCALLSKTVSSTWPAAVLVLMWWKNGRIRRRDVGSLLPFFAAGFVLSSLTTHLEKYRVGAMGPEWDFTILDRCMIAGRAIWFYLGKAIWPVDLIFIYPKWDLNENVATQLLVASAALIVLFTLVLLSRRIGRAPATAALLFAGTLAPALGFVNFYPQRYSFVADHFQYLAIIAVIVPVAWLLCRFTSQLAFLILLPLVFLTWQRCQIYHDPITFWSNAVARNGGSWMTHENLGEALESSGDLEKAGRQYLAATQADPKQAQAWFTLAAFQHGRHQYSLAEQSLRRVLQIDPTYPLAAHDLAVVIGLEQADSPK